jgi:hypothetical protein
MAMQQTLLVIPEAIEEERRVVLPIRVSERPRDYFASACLLAFMGFFWVLVFSLRFFVQSHHLR